jgi:hypothetical protein
MIDYLPSWCGSRVRELASGLRLDTVVLNPPSQHKSGPGGFTHHSQVVPIGRPRTARCYPAPGGEGAGGVMETFWPGLRYKA